MPANVCPKCGNPVMSYRTFARKAEPYKVSTCGSCGVKLRRNPKVYLLLLAMCMILALLGIPLFGLLTRAQLPNWIGIVLFIVLIGAWALLTNYLGWRLVGWIIAEGDKTA